jgi:urease accessory protein
VADGSTALLLVADGRFPAGAHAHSGGLEAIVAAGRVRDVASLEAFLIGRAATGGLVAASFAAAACHAAGDGDAERLGELDAELDARMPSPALRGASRKLGRQMVRATRAITPYPALHVLPDRPHQPVAFGTACAGFGLGPQATGLAALYDAVTSPATAAVKLLGLDPFAAHAALARCGGQLDALAAEAADYVHAPPDELPALGAPLLDVSNEHHATWEVRLFAS